MRKKESKLLSKEFNLVLLRKYHQKNFQTSSGLRGGYSSGRKSSKVN
jgi:hypothetical protein